ncbi:Hpt domain-containing protein [Ideonella sp. 4Y16]|uniref:Hpt domain-containing protein n=1 Tax=Ideonella alba TaxID=2824118 RepID=UPI001B35D0FE|nr:Hpt domain-containing protein [Ideonella alba]
MRRFTTDHADAIGALVRTLREESVEAAARSSHKLKGVLGNLAAHPMYERISEIDDLLKSNQAPDARCL